MLFYDRCSQARASWKNLEDHPVYAHYYDAQQRDRQQVEQAGECHVCAATGAEAGDILQPPALTQALAQAGGIQAEEQEQKEKKGQADDACERNRYQSSQEHRPQTSIVKTIGKGTYTRLHFSFAFRLPLSQVVTFPDRQKLKKLEAEL
jgi:hypothetical protein